LQNSGNVLVSREGRDDGGGIGGGEVEDCRFALKTFLHFRAICDSISEASVADFSGGGRPSFESGRDGPSIGSGASVSSGGTSQFSLGSSVGEGGNEFKFRLQDVCDEDIMNIGELGDRKIVGTEVNLEGKTIFRCFPLSEFADGKESDGVFNVDIMDGKPIGAELYLVVDTSMLYLCEPEEGVNGGEVTRVVCNVPMRNITGEAAGSKRLE
jgi:hypothetical protein